MSEGRPRRPGLRKGAARWKVLNGLPIRDPIGITSATGDAPIAGALSHTFPLDWLFLPQNTFPSCRMSLLDGKYAFVENEDCNIRYWYQGAGPLLIMVPGGSGHGAQFDAIMPLLSTKFTVATYDRRQMSGSKVKVPRNLNPVQCVRDIIAIVHAMGRRKTSIFANSGGGIIALQMAVSFPEILEHVVCHETPTTSLLPDSTHHMNRCFELLRIFEDHGPAAANAAFHSELKGFENSPPLTPFTTENMDNFYRHEYMLLTLYCPDLRKIVDNKVSIVVTAGVKSEDAFYARATIYQSEILCCRRVIVPGHHKGYEAWPTEFAPALLECLDRMEEARPKY